ncbi:hypothetical protein DITRI_Ditri04bG0122600 [Diplodiscus trichospermus]
MEQVKEPVKEQREHVLAIACRVMAGVSPVVAANSQSQSQQQQQQFPTPSPFSFSGTSTRWSSRPLIQHSHLFLRFLVLIFSFISALTLAAPSGKKKDQRSHSFTGQPELIYCFIVAILNFLYAAFQLFKGICDIAHRGILISDMTSDYLGFIIDQLVGYLLISSASVAIPIIGQATSSARELSGDFACWLVYITVSVFHMYMIQGLVI